MVEWNNIKKSCDEIQLKLQKAERIQKNNINQIKKYQKKLKNLNSELTITEEKERKAIAGYLHDGIGQTLSIAHIRLTSLLNEELNPKTKKTIDESSKLIDNAITESRLLTYDLSPPILYELGLIPAIKWKLDQIQLKVGISSDFNSSEPKILLDTNSLILVYRVICELLLNIIKHASANSIKVIIDKIRKNYHIAIIDNGVGFDYKKVSSQSKPTGYGLFSINERLDSINGSFIINSKNNNGTVAKIIVPT